MERYPRGTLPPAAYVEIPQAPPRPVAAAPSTLERGPPAPTRTRGGWSRSVTCPTLSTLMQPEHAHYRCATCGYRDSCCF